MDEKQIQKLIETATAQLAYSYTPYSHFKVGRLCLGRTERFIQDVTLKCGLHTDQLCREDGHFQGGQRGSPGI